MQILLWLSCWVHKGGMFIQEVDACIRQDLSCYWLHYRSLIVHLIITLLSSFDDHPKN